jgi:8-hydroxy-5-deazaflavin:NADPH oxidoreductase
LRKQLVCGARTNDTQEHEMQITIVGTGNMARGIASRALAGGHDVTLVGTERAKAEDLAGELGGAGGSGSVQAGDAPTGDVAVLAVPYPAVAGILDAHRDALAGTVLVDITNPVDFSTFTPLDLDAGSAAQEIAAAAPDAKVVKAFNTTFAGTLVEGSVSGQPLDVFLAGDDDGAKATVKQIVEDGGMRAVDAGPLARARQLEALGYLHMALQEPLGTGFASAVKVVA